MLLVFCCFLLQLLADGSAFFDVQEISDVKYGIDILDTPVMAGQDQEGSVITLASKFGQQYQCSYLDQHQGADMKEKEEEQVAMKTGIVDLLKPMADRNCLSLSKGWWTYEFCFGKYIKQYHMEDGVTMGDTIYLGFYQSDFDWSNTTQTKKAYKQRYHSQEYVNGTQCDLTGKPRQAQVRFFCEYFQTDYLSGVDEMETCVYTLYVQTSRICHHPFLKPPAKNKAVPIVCHPLLSPEEYQEYKQMKEAEEEKKKSIMKEMIIESEKNPDPFIVSDQATEGSVSDSSVESDDIGEPLTDDLDSATDALQKLITRSLVDGLNDVLGTDKNKVKVTRLKTKMVRQGDLESLIKEVMSKTKDDSEDSDSSDDSGKVADLDEGDDEDAEDEDKALLREFDKGLDELAKSDVSLEEVKRYKDTIQKEMNAQFTEIIREAEDELNEAGFKDEIDRDATLKAMSETLEKLLKRLERKQGTGHSKEISSMIEKAAATTLQTLDVGSSKKKDKHYLKEEQEEEVSDKFTEASNDKQSDDEELLTKDNSQTVTNRGVINEDSEVIDGESNLDEKYGHTSDDSHFAEEDGHVVDEEGQVVDDGQTVDEDGQIVDEDGQIVDEDGQIIEDGQIVDEDGQIVDEEMGDDLEEDVIGEDSDITGEVDSEDDKDFVSMEYEIKYNDKPHDISSDIEQTDKGLQEDMSRQASYRKVSEPQQPSQEQPHEFQVEAGNSDFQTETETGESLPQLDAGDEDQSPGRGAKPQSDKTDGGDSPNQQGKNDMNRESSEPQTKSLQFSKSTKSNDGKYETSVYSDSDIKIRVTARHYDEDEKDEDERSEVRKQDEPTPKVLKAVNKGTERRVQEAVQKRLTESGIKVSGQTIQVKIFTSDDYYGTSEEKADIFGTNGALNKMLVAVLGSNTDELVEARRQEKLTNNYRFVWKKDKKQKEL